MTGVKISDRKVWVDDQSISLISSEAHYWRLNPHNWRPILRRVVGAGKWRIEDLILGRTQMTNLTGDTPLSIHIPRKNGTIIQLSRHTDK
jgi:hypothetical protein